MLDWGSMPLQVEPWTTRETHPCHSGLAQRYVLSGRPYRRHEVHFLPGWLHCFEPRNREKRAPQRPPSIDSLIQRSERDVLPFQLSTERSVLPLQLSIRPKPAFRGRRTACLSCLGNPASRTDGKVGTWGFEPQFTLIERIEF